MHEDTQPEWTDWGHQKSFLDVLQRHILPALEDNRHAAALALVCSSWRQAACLQSVKVNGARLTSRPLVALAGFTNKQVSHHNSIALSLSPSLCFTQATLWGSSDLLSMHAYLSRHQSSISELDLSTADTDVCTLHDVSSLACLLEVLPPRCLFCYDTCPSTDELRLRCMLRTPIMQRAL